MSIFDHFKFQRQLQPGKIEPDEIVDGELLEVIEPKDFLDRVMDVGVAIEDGQDSFIGSLFDWLGL